MSLSHALLGLLAVEPRSGYALTKALGEEGVGRYAWSAGHTSIYPELARLAELGLISVVGEGARGKRVYDITAEGRLELRNWLVDMPLRPAVVRNEIVLRMFLLAALEPADAIGILQRIVSHVADEAKQLRQLREAGGGVIPDGPAGFGHIAAEYGVRVDDAVRDWALWAIDQFERRK